MAAEDFFKRWSRPSPEADRDSASAPASVQSTVSGNIPPASATLQATVSQAVVQGEHSSEVAPIPTLDDVEKLEVNSDFSRFMAKDVDETVKRSAMKKLFSNPHFNIMDGLDIYIGDYSQPDPLPLGMLEKILHAETLLNPLQHLEAPLQTLLDSERERAQQQPKEEQEEEPKPQDIQPDLEKTVPHQTEQDVEKYLEQNHPDKSGTAMEEMATPELCTPDTPYHQCAIKPDTFDVAQVNKHGTSAQSDQCQLPISAHSADQIKNETMPE
ncbi:DUF3306 domain-containing protein [Undibacterium sp. SXout7W]|uniref:DUF3306 domain-containing protein n=1 Tax=Undibacterium sp. SXout7W TaxID=3413049 RepID=UPI003BF191D3